MPAPPVESDAENVSLQPTQPAPAQKLKPAIASRPGQRSAFGNKSHLSKGRVSEAYKKQLEAAMRELEDRGEEWHDDSTGGWNREKELKHTRTIAKKVKSPTPPQLSNQLNVFIGGSLPAPVQAPTTMAPRRAPRAPARRQAAAKRCQVAAIESSFKGSF